MALCATCKRFDLRTILRSPDDDDLAINAEYYVDEQRDLICFRHSDNMFQIRRSASAGCSLCSLMFAAFKRKGAEAAEIAGNLPVVLTCGTSDADDHSSSEIGKLKLQMFAQLASTDEGLIELCKFDLSSSRDGAFTEFDDLPFHPYNKLGPDLSDASCMERAFQWVWTCVKNHDCSAPEIPASNLVTRFLDVGNARKRPFLVEFAPGTLPKHWIALSYCWGQVFPLQRLTKTSEEALHRGIEIRKFDATVRDAILVARALEVQHLWIDALCIFQDEKSDWEKQSSQMNNIYGNSTVTLAPVDSKCVSQGFLVQRSKPLCRIPWRTPSDRLENRQDQSPKHFYLSESRDPSTEPLNSPWSKRGWTFQEGLLPNRILLYTHNQMIWKCRSEILYESGLRRQPLVEVVRRIFDEGGGTDFWSLDNFTKFKLLPWYIAGPEGHIAHEKYRIWYSLVEDYCSRGLTHPRDRLVAISGLAKAYGGIIKDDQYFAGFWRRDMIRGLLWRVSGATLSDAYLADGTSDDELDAPSWCWASVPPKVPIRNPWAETLDFGTLATVEEVIPGLIKPSNPFGVICARIRICGPVYRFSKLYREGWQSPSTPLSAFERHISCIVEHEHEHECECERVETAKKLGHEDSYAALLMLQERGSWENRVDVLILQSVALDKDSRGSIFKRLGVITLSHIDKTFTSSAPFAERAKQWESSLRFRLRPGGGPRGVRQIECHDVFEELKRNRWPRQTVTIV